MEREKRIFILKSPRHMSVGKRKKGNNNPMLTASQTHGPSWTVAVYGMG